MEHRCSSPLKERKNDCSPKGSMEKQRYRYQDNKGNPNRSSDFDFSFGQDHQSLKGEVGERRSPTGSRWVANREFVKQTGNEKNYKDCALHSEVANESRQDKNLVEFAKRPIPSLRPKI